MLNIPCIGVLPACQLHISEVESGEWGQELCCFWCMFVCVSLRKGGGVRLGRLGAYKAGRTVLCYSKRIALQTWIVGSCKTTGNLLESSVISVIQIIYAIYCNLGNFYLNNIHILLI